MSSHPSTTVGDNLIATVAQTETLGCPPPPPPNVLPVNYQEYRQGVSKFGSAKFSGIPFGFPLKPTKQKLPGATVLGAQPKKSVSTRRNFFEVLLCPVPVGQICSRPLHHRALGQARQHRLQLRLRRLLDCASPVSFWVAELGLDLPMESK